MTKVDPQSIIGSKLSFKNREFNFSEKQQEILRCLMDEKTKVVFLSGCAGTSKTYMAIYAALNIIDRDFSKDLIYIRTIQESGARSLGSLPGEIDSKFSPFQIPLEEKCEEILEDHCTKGLFESGKMKAIPVNYLRGSSFKNKIICMDESQNFSLAETVTSVSRIGEGTKLFICGDPNQVDLPHNVKSGFTSFITAFDNQESRDHGIYHFHFGTEDIVRSEILKFIVEKIETIPKGK